MHFFEDTLEQRCDQKTFRHRGSTYISTLSAQKIEKKNRQSKYCEFHFPQFLLSTYILSATYVGTNMFDCHGYVQEIWTFFWKPGTL